MSNKKAGIFMKYEGIVYRPPSEARSLIIQATVGCARNTCRFCYMYKDKHFRAKAAEEVIGELKQVRNTYPYPVRRIFLADGDALILKTETLEQILLAVQSLFPEIERISAYGAPKDILMKSPDELLTLKKLGLSLIYTGIESGSDTVLKMMEKGASSEEMILSGRRLKSVGIAQSVTFISGLGGSELLEEHALACAKVLSEIAPAYASFLTLMLEPGTPLYEDAASGKFKLLSAAEIVDEMMLFLSHTDSEGTIFRSNHASNYISLAGTLNRDIPQMLSALRAAKKHQTYKPETWRAL